jgi:putative ABC transport system permease protein
MAALAVSTGDTINLGGRPVKVTATFPESLLTLATGAEGFAKVSGQHLWQDRAVPPDLPGHLLMVRLPADATAAASVTSMLTGTLGPHGLLYRPQDLTDAVRVGVNLLKHTLFWAALLIIFISAFGVAFGVEDYVNSKSDEIATLKMVGLATRLVAGVILLRLILAGVVAALLAVALGSAITAATSHLVGTRAAAIAQVARLTRFPWEFVPIGIILLLAFGRVPLWLRLSEKPHRVLWSKLRGAPLTSRTGAGVGSLLATLVISFPVMLGLARWYLGDGQAQAIVFAVMAGGVMLILGLVYACVRAVAALRPLSPAAWSWPLTYLRAGAARTVAATTAVALALAIGTGVALMDRVLDWELQAAIRRPVPLTVYALTWHATFDALTEDDISASVSGLGGVEATVWGDFGYAYLRRGGWQTSRGFPAKAVSPEQAALFGSPLAGYLQLAQPGTHPLTAWEEALGFGPPEEILGTRYLLVGATDPSRPPVGDPVPVTLVALEPSPGLRFGLPAMTTMPRGTLPLPRYQVLGVRVDPAYAAAVVDYLRQDLGFPAIVDLSPAMGYLRKATDELSFIWWATAAIALMVSVVILLSTSSVARIARTYDLAVLRVIGVSGWRLAAGPCVEFLAQGLIAGLAGSLVGVLAVYRGLPLVVAVELPAHWVIPSVTIAASVGISTLLGVTAYRRHLGRPPLEVLRSE